MVAIGGLMMLFSTGLWAQQVASTAINWRSWPQTETSAAPGGGQKMLIYLFTDWCAWCKRMDGEVFANQDLAGLINQYFVPVKLNAETRDPLTFRGREYRYVRDGKLGYHELAAEWLNGRLSFPSIIFIDENQQVIQAVSGVKTLEQLEQIVLYFGQNHYLSTPWTTFQRNFRSQLTE